MTLKALQSEFQRQVEQSGAISVTAATLFKAELNPPQGFDSLIKADLILKSPSLLVYTGNIPEPIDNELSIKGTATFLNLKKIPVSLIFSIDEDGITNLQLIGELGNKWQFNESFPFLTGYPTNTLSFSDANYLFSTQAIDTYTWKTHPIKVEQGLNFLSFLVMDNSFTRLRTFAPSLNEQDKVVFFGTINPRKMIDPTIIYPDINLIGKISGDVHIPYFHVSDPAIGLTVIQRESIYFDIRLYFIVNININEKNSFQFKAAILQDGKNFTFALVPDLSKPVTVENIINLIGKDFETAIPDTLKDIFDEISLKGFSTSLYLPGNEATKVRNLSVAIGTASPWHVIDGLTVNDITLQYSLFNPFTENSTDLSFFSASFQFYPDLFFGDFLVEMTSDNQQLSIAASYTGDVSLNDIICVMSKNSITIPKQMLDIRFSDFGMAFSSQSEQFDYDFYANAEISFDLAILGSRVSSNFQLVVNSVANIKSYVLSGGLSIGNSYFSATLNLNDKTSILNASWKALNKNYLGINELVRAFGFSGFLIPADLDLNLKTAHFDYDFSNETMMFEAESVVYGKMLFISKKQNNKWQYVFVFKLNTEQLHIDELPFFGKFPEESRIGLTKLQFTGASNAILKDEMDFWNSWAGQYEFVLPQEIKARGASISAEVILGSFKADLFLSLSATAPAPSIMTDQSLCVISEDSLNRSAVWIKVQNSLGPLYFNRIGFAYQDSKLSLLLDAAVELTGLYVEVNGLSVNAPLNNLSDLSCSIQGLSFDFYQKPIAISGGLLKSFESSGQLAFKGEALLSMPGLTVTALGSYTRLIGSNDSSLFIIAVINKALGGTPYFYVTGLAAGFGYNRYLKIPMVSEIQDFPLVAGLANDSLIGGANPTPAQALAVLDDWVPPMQGQYWLAGGIQGTTFEIINSNLLLVVEFGKDTVISVLGVAVLKQPQKGNTFVYAALNIAAAFWPQQGLLQVAAELAPGSYVLAREAHLTGGFAFYSWFADNPHAGDFVLTLGGYHPAFRVPDYYPQVPSVGINWKVSNAIVLIGSCYFVIVPVGMMAGANLQLTFQSGPLKAWLKAKTDVLLFWKPFYFMAEATVSVGVTLRIHACFVDTTLSVEVGTNFQLWGPEMGASVYIDWAVISFTINFGSSKILPADTISWNEFKEMLPTKTQEIQTHTALQNTITKPVYLNINPQQGLTSIVTVEDETIWLVRIGQFQFSLESAIPASEIVIRSKHVQDERHIQGQKVGMSRVNGNISPEDYQSQQTISIVQVAEDGMSNMKKHMFSHQIQPENIVVDEPIDITTWEINAIEKSLPPALWSGSKDARPIINASSATILGTTGIVMALKVLELTNCTPDMQIDKVFSLKTINPDNTYRLPIYPDDRVEKIVYETDSHSFNNISHINDEIIRLRRTEIFNTLQALHINGLVNDTLSNMAENPGLSFVDEPLEATLYYH